MFNGLDTRISETLPMFGAKKKRKRIPQEPSDVVGIPLLITEFQKYSKELHAQQRLLDAKIAIQEQNNLLNRQHLDTQYQKIVEKKQTLDQYINLFSTTVTQLQAVTNALQNLLSAHQSKIIDDPYKVLQTQKKVRSVSM
jgi:hypothetical protein